MAPQGAPKGNPWSPRASAFPLLNKDCTVCHHAECLLCAQTAQNTDQVTRCTVKAEWVPEKRLPVCGFVKDLVWELCWSEVTGTINQSDPVNMRGLNARQRWWQRTKGQTVIGNDKVSVRQDQRSKNKSSPNTGAAACAGQQCPWASLDPERAAAGWLDSLPSLNPHFKWPEYLCLLQP